MPAQTSISVAAAMGFLVVLAVGARAFAQEDLAGHRYASSGWYFELAVGQQQPATRGPYPERGKAYCAMREARQWGYRIVRTPYYVDVSSQQPEGRGPARAASDLLQQSLEPRDVSPVAVLLPGQSQQTAGPPQLPAALALAQQLPAQSVELTEPAGPVPSALVMPQRKQPFFYCRVYVKQEDGRRKYLGIFRNDSAIVEDLRARTATGKVKADLEPVPRM